MDVRNALEVKHKKLLITSITLALVVCSIICITVSIFDGHFYFVCVMPLMALLMFLIGKTNKKHITHMSLIIINLSIVMRYGLYPAVMLLSGDTTILLADDTEAILLIVYELVGINFVIAFKGKTFETITPSLNNYDSQLGIVTLLLIAFMVPACIISPSLLNQFSLSSLTIKQVDEGTAGFVVSFFTMGIWTLLTYILCSLGKTSKSSNRLIKVGGLLLAILISLLYLLSRVINGSNIRRWGIICTGLVISIILTKVFPARKKQIWTLATIGIIAGVVVGSVIKFNEQSSLYLFLLNHGSYTSFDAYFSGIRGVRSGLNMIQVNPLAGTFRSTLTDFFSGIPIISRLFDANIDSVPVMYLDYVHRSDLICPILVQSVAHFGIIGAPIISMIFTWAAIECNKRLVNTRNLYKTFVYVELTFYLSLMLELNTLIIFGVVWVRIIYLILLRFDFRVRLYK